MRTSGERNQRMHYTSLRRVASYLLAISILCSVVLAQQPAQQSAPSVERLREIVTYLASDPLAGRRTGSPGANDAARYIAGEFQRYGLRDADKSARVSGGSVNPQTLREKALARYLQPFPYVAGVELGKENLFTFSRGRYARGQTPPADSAGIVSLRVGEDWMPLGLSANGTLENITAVVVSYGITAAELNYDDYAGKDVAGKIAIARSGTPDGDNPHGRFARYEDIRWKAIAAHIAGAKALIVVSREDDLKEDRLSQLRYDNAGGDAGVPVIVMSRKAAVRLFTEASPSNIEQFLEQEAAKSEQAAAALLLSKLFLTLSTDVIRKATLANNVMGILEGSDPQLKNEAIVIGAHYDHLGRGGDGSLAPREGEIHHGADDNASGVAGLL